MRIAFFFDEPDYFGGAGSLLLKQAKLMSEVHEALVVVPTNSDGIENPKCVKWCEAAGLKHVGLRYTTAYNFRDIDLLGALRSAECMCRLIEEEHIEFLHTTQINVAAELAARKMKIPHLMNIYQLTEEEFAFKQTDFYPRYHLCDSEMYSALWSRKLNMVSECMRPLSPLDKQREYRKTFKKQQTIVMVGLLCERKNQLTAIRAVEKLQDKTDLRLIIAGDCDNTYGKKCRDYVEEHNLQKRVLFSGFVLDVGELLEEADGFLLASTDESFPSSIVEAVSYGVPILTTPVGGVPEVFINHVNAFVSEDYSVAGVVRMLEDYCKCMDDKIFAIQKSAAMTWEIYFSLSANRKKLDEYYERILEDFANVCRKDPFDEGFINDVEETEKLMLQVCRDDIKVAKKAFYYNFALKKIQSSNKKEIYIWGAGFLGNKAFDFLSSFVPNNKIAGFLDINKKGVCRGIPVYTPEEIIRNRKECMIIISFGGDIRGALKLLKEQGFVCAESVWILP